MEVPTAAGYTALPPILICLALLLPMPKRIKAWPALMAAYIAINLIPPGFFSLTFAGPQDSFLWFFPWLTHYLIIVLLILGSCEVPVPGAFYLATLAYSTLFILYSLQGVVLCLLPQRYSFPAYLLLCFLLAVAAYIFFTWQIIGKKLYCIPARHLTAVFSVFAITSLIFFYFINLLHTNLSVETHTCLLLIHLNCVCILYMMGASHATAEMQREQQIMTQLLQSRRKQYDILKANMERTNQSCHDMKHQILALQHTGLDGSQKAFLDEALENIRSCEIILNTENDALNVVLADKAMECKEKNISLYCMIDGKALNFMEPVDIYNIFGNALDNAVESVSAQPDGEKRTISVRASVKQNCCVIQVENYCANPPRFQGGLPVTTKADSQSHGYGVKSILYSAEKYRGAVSIRTENQTFSLRILIPRPAQTQ